MSEIILRLADIASRDWRRALHDLKTTPYPQASSIDDVRCRSRQFDSSIYYCASIGLIFVVVVVVVFVVFWL